MAFRVADALNLKTFENAVLLGGKKGLYKPIRWVNILEILDEISLVRPQELLITTAFGLAHDSELQQKLIPTLAKKELSCLTIQTGFYLKKVPQKIIADAEKFAIPLIELPQDTSFSQITTDLLTRIVNNQFALLDYRDKVRHELLEVVLENAGFEGLVQVLKKHLKIYPIRIMDRSYTPVAHSQVNPEILATKTLTMEANHLRREGYLTQLEQEKKWVFVNVRDPAFVPQQVLVPILAAGNQVLGYISVLGLPEQLSDEQLTLLEQSATICALLFLRQIAVKETENRLQSDFLDDLLAGNFSSGEQIGKRANFLGYDLRQYGMILLANIDNFSGYIQEKNEVDIINLKNDLLHLVDTAVKSYTYHQFITRLRSDNIIVFVLSPSPENDRWQKQLARTIRDRVNWQYPELSLSIGMGRFYNDIHEFSKSFDEAEKALQIARKLYNSAATAAFEELGFYRLLQNGERELYNFYRETIGGLAEYDQKKGTGLEKTLEVYLENNRNIQTTAEKLFIHRHTLRYRLKRIEEITGVSLSESDNIFNLQVGLKLHKILG